MRIIAVTLLVSFLGRVSRGGEVRFSSGPTARGARGRVEIAFAVSKATDVEVAVLDSRGGVVRHLAAGVLGGKNPPPEPLKPGFRQRLEWDVRDDFGKKASGEPFKVRVRAGTGVKFGRFIGGDPCTFGSVVALAADEDGDVYIMGHGGNRNQNFRTVRVFDPEGKYLRTVMPFPAHLGPGAMKDVARWDEAGKTFRPRNLNSLNPEFYVNAGLSLVSASKKNGIVLTDGGRVYRLEGRGGVAGSAFAGEDLWPRKGALKNTGGGPVFMSASPDGEYLYLSGPFSSKTRYGHKFDPRFPPGRVYRMRLGAGQTVQPFVTISVDHEEGQGGAWTRHNKRNHGISAGPVHGTALDTEGSVYVCDRQNQRVAIFGEDGKELGELRVANAHQIAVHPRTRAVYVLTRHCTGYWRYQVAVVKFKRVGEGARPAAEHVFPPQKTAGPQMALVASGKKTAVYVAGVPGGLVALEDKGTSFQPVKTALAPQKDALDVFNRMEADPVRGEVYVSDGGNLYWRFDGKTGKGELLKKGGKPFLATDLAVGYDGLLYFQTGQGYSGPLERYTRELEPAPYSTGTHVLSKYIYGRYGIGNCEKGIGVGPDGKVYVSWMFSGWVKYAVSAWGPDGKPLNGKYSEIDKGHYKRGTPEGLKRAVIGPIPGTNGGVRVDLQGNIYLGVWYWPKGRPYGKAFEKDRGYKHMTGSVIKFGPEGGRFPGEPAMMAASSVEGAKHIYPGLSPFSHPHLGTTCCVCRVPRFDVDRWDRLAIPNATGSYVLLVDNAGNEVLRFGRYGNFDSQYVNPNTKSGKEGKPTVAVPDIPLAWPTCAALSEEAIYVLDIYNRRVVRADLTYAAEEACAVR